MIASTPLIPVVILADDTTCHDCGEGLSADAEVGTTYDGNDHRIYVCDMCRHDRIREGNDE